MVGRFQLRKMKIHDVHHHAKHVGHLLLTQQSVASFKVMIGQIDELVGVFVWCLCLFLLPKPTDLNTKGLI